MKRLISACVALIAFSALPAKADLVISANPILFNGAGSYTVDILATARESSFVIGGFNISIDFSAPELTLENVAYNSEFGSVLPVSPGASTAFLQGTDLDSITDPFRIDQDQSRSLATVTFNATGPAQAPIAVSEISDSFFQPVTAVSSPEMGAVSVTAIPEPSSIALLAGLGGFAMLRRRRR